GIASSTELFDVLGVQPRIGRGFHAGEDGQGAERVAVLSDALWRDLGADPSIVGKRLKLHGIQRTVIGIMPRGFWFPDPSTRVWVSDYMNPTGRSGIYSLIGRVAPGQSVLNMKPVIDRATQLLGSQYTYPPEWDRTKNAKLTPLRDD